MEHKVRETVSTVEEKCDFIQCDKCGAILHVNVHAHGRLKAIDAGEDKIVRKAVYYETRCYDPDLEESEYHHYCPGCILQALTDWMGLDMPCCHDPEIEISKHLGVITKNFSIHEHDKSEESHDHGEDTLNAEKARNARIIESIKSGTHPIIQAEEEMLNGLSVGHPPEGRGEGNDG